MCKLFVGDEFDVMSEGGGEAGECGEGDVISAFSSDDVWLLYP